MEQAGGEIYKSISPGKRLDREAKAEASKLLQSIGIRGIKYLDQGSRDIGEGTHNFVVFDPNDLEILRILGITGAVAGGASQIPQRAQNGPQS